MSIPDLIESIPKVLVYVVPGFLILTTSRLLVPENSEPEQFTVFRTLVHSTILVQITRPVYNLFHLELASGAGFVLLVALSILVGVLRGKFFQSNLREYLGKLAGIHVNPHASVWNRKLDTAKGRWARAYLDEQKVMYEGYVAETTLDPYSPAREIFLGEPKVYDISRPHDPKLLRDMTNVVGSGVLLQASQITRIELMP